MPSPPVENFLATILVERSKGKFITFKYHKHEKRTVKSNSMQCA